MIQEDQECIDIVTQLTAIRSSINSTLGVVISNRISQVIHHPEEDAKDQRRAYSRSIKDDYQKITFYLQGYMNLKFIRAPLKTP